MCMGPRACYLILQLFFSASTVAKSERPVSCILYFAHMPYSLHITPLSLHQILTDADANQNHVVAMLLTPSKIIRTDQQFILKVVGSTSLLRCQLGQSWLSRKPSLSQLLHKDACK